MQFLMIGSRHQKMRIFGKLKTFRFCVQTLRCRLLSRFGENRTAQMMLGAWITHGLVYCRLWFKYGVSLVARESLDIVSNRRETTCEIRRPGLVSEVFEQNLLHIRTGSSYFRDWLFIAWRVWRRRGVTLSCFNSIGLIRAIAAATCSILISCPNLSVGSIMRVEARNMPVTGAANASARLMVPVGQRR